MTFAGWALPEGALSYHGFDGASRSLCGKWPKPEGSELLRPELPVDKPCPLCWRALTGVDLRDMPGGRASQLDITQVTGEPEPRLSFRRRP